VSGCVIQLVRKWVSKRANECEPVQHLTSNMGVRALPGLFPSSMIILHKMTTPTAEGTPETGEAANPKS